eukprot:GEMP01006410.1.p1 GENE.GEMP01006410.1~~GEMP01006410.1.p1  ORF type:complete len:854 (+),score=227.61 GEMP01006410.1:23-2584(+)
MFSPVMRRDSVGEFFNIPGFVPPLNIPVQDECPPTNEVDCDTVFYCRAKLFRFCSMGWKKRASGHMMILRDEKFARFVFLQARTRTMAANCLLTHNAPFNELKVNEGSDKCFVFTAQDFSDGSLNVLQFAVKLETKELADEFFEAFNTAKSRPKTMKALQGVDEEIDKDRDEGGDSETEAPSNNEIADSSKWFDPEDDTVSDIDEELLEIPGFTPSMTLEVQETRPEDSDELEHSSHRAKLYRFRDDQWKERGVGEAMILRNINGNMRFVMRNEKTLRLIANFFIIDSPPYCILKANDNPRCWVFCAQDWSEPAENEDGTTIEGEACRQNEQFALKFATEELKDNFTESWESAKLLLGFDDVREEFEKRRQTLYFDALERRESLLLFDPTDGPAKGQKKGIVSEGIPGAAPFSYLPIPATLPLRRKNSAHDASSTDLPTALNASSATSPRAGTRTSNSTTAAAAAAGDPATSSSSSAPKTKKSLAAHARAAMLANDSVRMTRIARKALLECTDESRRVAFDLTCMIALEVYDQQRVFHGALIKRQEEKRRVAQGVAHSAGASAAAVTMPEDRNLRQRELLQGREERQRERERWEQLPDDRKREELRLRETRHYERHREHRRSLLRRFDHVSAVAAAGENTHTLGVAAHSRSSLEAKYTEKVHEGIVQDDKLGQVALAGSGQSNALQPTPQKTKDIVNNDAVVVSSSTKRDRRQALASCEVTNLLSAANVAAPGSRETQLEHGNTMDGNSETMDAAVLHPSNNEPRANGTHAHPLASQSDGVENDAPSRHYGDKNAHLGATGVSSSREVAKRARESEDHTPDVKRFAAESSDGAVTRARKLLQAKGVDMRVVKK